MLGNGPAIAVFDHFPFIPAAFQIFNVLLVRRLYLTATRVSDEKSAPDKKAFEQMDFFTDYVNLRVKTLENGADRGSRFASA